MPDGVVAPGLAGLVPLAVELCDLKRVRDASSPDSLASRLFRRAWGALAAGQDVADVAFGTTADAVAAARLGGIDRGVLAVAGVEGDAADAVLRRSFDEVAGPLDPVLSRTLRAHLGVTTTPGPAPAFEAALQRVQEQIATASRLRGAFRHLPVRHPLTASAEMTSSYGVRSDPFTRGMAMHTGVDFRAEQGAPVRATGTGRIVTAEYSGGYGNLVEIDHGGGLTSRYAHLSSIEVDEGRTVEAGALVGRVGSTGRSTGAHLHYETRLGGDAADPTRFLRVGAKHRDLF